MAENEVLQRLSAKLAAKTEERSELLEQRQAIVEAAKVEGREDLEPEEDTEFRGFTDAIKALDESIADLSERVQELTDEADRSRVAAAAARRAKAGQVKVVSEGPTYYRGSDTSYFRDLVKSKLDNDSAAVDRLRRHAQDVEENPEYREFRDLNRVDGTGGEFVPPIYLVQQYVELARGSRPTANLAVNLPLPAGTDSINIPKVATGTTTAIQSGDNTAISETDLTDANVNAPVRTIAGQQDISVQLLEQSPVAFDEVIFRDLSADYAYRLNQQVLTGNVTTGMQVQGILTQASTNTVSFSGHGATVSSAYPKIADAIQKVHTTRFQSPEVIVMHPRRWAWFTAAVDTTGRPLVLPDAQGPNNAAGILTNVASQQVVGTIQGLPVVTDPGIPVNLGSSTIEDVILVMRASDLLLWESPIKTRVYPSVGSGTLTVRLQVYGYLAFTAGRYPQSISKVTGYDLRTPTF
jgi:HK97 family phage major capsid protein